MNVPDTYSAMAESDSPSLRDWKKIFQLKDKTAL